MNRYLSLLALPALTVGFLACGGGKKDAVVVPAPSDLTLNEVGYREIELGWKAPAGAVTGYQVFAKFGAGEWSKPDHYFSEVTAYYRIVDTVPELTLCTYRVRAQIGYNYSAYTNEVTYRIPVAPAAALKVASVPGGLELTWTANSQVADTLLVERGVAPDASSAPTHWTVVPDVAMGTTRLLDTQATQGAFNSYRVTYAKGEDKSAVASEGRFLPALEAPSK